MDIAGVLGGIGAFSAVEGTIASFTMLGSLAGPAGMAAGFLAGVGVSMVVGLIAHKTKHAITAKRGSQAKRAIEPLVKEYEDKIYTTISSNTNSVFDEMIDVLHTYMDDRRTYYESVMCSKEQTADDEYKCKYDVSELNEHYTYLESKKEALR